MVRTQLTQVFREIILYRFFLLRELLLLAVPGVKYSGGRTLFVPAHAGFFELH
jgi:hypothetical protein